MFENYCSKTTLVKGEPYLYIYCASLNGGSKRYFIRSWEDYNAHKIFVEQWKKDLEDGIEGDIWSCNCPYKK